MGKEKDEMQKHFINGYSAQEYEKKIEAAEASKKRKLYTHMVLLMLSSTANIVVQAYQNETKVDNP